MAEPKSAVRSQGSEYGESSQHDMMSLVNMATGTAPSKAPTVNEIGDQLRTQQWEQYLNEQLVRNRASNKIAFLASNVKTAYGEAARSRNRIPGRIRTRGYPRITPAPTRAQPARHTHSHALTLLATCTAPRLLLLRLRHARTCSHSPCRGLRVDCAGTLRGYRGGTGGPGR